jgi:hypothetical protein
MAVERRRTELSSECPALGVEQVGERDARAFRSEAPRLRRALPARRTRDERNPAPKPIAHAASADAARIGFGLYSGGLGTPTGLVCDAYLDSEALALDSSRSFEIAIGCDATPGQGLRSGPATNIFNARITLLHRATDRLPELELVRQGAAAKPPPLDPAAFSHGLDRVGRVLEGTVNQFLAWTRSFADHRHEVREIDPVLAAAAQGDPKTRYFYSDWQIAEDEAFVVDLEPPPCEYWNLQIGNHWLESLDFMRFETHVNSATAVADDSGRVRVVVAHRDPGVPNWLDTAGRARGGLALRWIGAERIPETRARVVPISELRAG